MVVHVLVSFVDFMEIFTTFLKKPPAVLVLGGWLMLVCTVHVYTYTCSKFLYFHIKRFLLLWNCLCKQCIEYLNSQSYKMHSDWLRGLKRL